jgi:carbonic anhydrase/acetyltransferase-like protein (isoleucine patch superfamily)
MPAELKRFHAREPSIHPDAAFIAPSADIMGHVEIGPGASVWFQCVIRGDINHIVVGEGSNIQDGTIIHVADDHPAIIGRDVTVGHRAIIHACTIGDGTLVGMGAVVMDGAVIGEDSVIAAGALVPKGMIVPPHSLVMGLPAKIVRPLSPGEQGQGRFLARKYREVARQHRLMQEKTGP